MTVIKNKNPIPKCHSDSGVRAQTLLKCSQFHLFAKNAFSIPRISGSFFRIAPNVCHVTKSYNWVYDGTSFSILAD
jgi:hypothetical protein